jgi:hypothetical protein
MIPVHGYATIQLTSDYFTKVLGVPFYRRYDDTNSPSAPIVWSSWPNYYESVTEQDIIRNMDWLATNLKPYGFEYVVLDDGYDRPPDFERSAATGHAWIQNWNAVRFPHGPEWLTHSIHARGLKAGLWLVPNAYAPALQEHPDWYLYDKQGRMLLDYDTPALDSTNPHVLEFLRHLFTTLDNLGFDYYKFDGDSALPAYAPPVDSSRLYSPSTDPVDTADIGPRAVHRRVPGRYSAQCDWLCQFLFQWSGRLRQLAADVPALQFHHRQSFPEPYGHIRDAGRRCGTGRANDHGRGRNEARSGRRWGGTLT